MAFAVPSKRLGAEVGSSSGARRRTDGYLHVPAPPSPQALCRAVAVRLAAAQSLAGRYSLSFDSRSARVRLELEGRRRPAAAAGPLRARVEGGGLARALGLGGSLDWATAPAGLPAAPFGGLDHVELSAGWYSPSHRPMGTAPPLRLPEELEARLNRLALLPSDKEDAPPPCVVVRDVARRVHAATLPRGLYSPPTLAAQLQAALNRATPEARFTCAFDEASERFAVECSSSEGAGGRPLRFDLLFSHPLSLDASRLGFVRGADCIGQARYESAEPVHVPRFGGRPAANLYEVRELGPTKRLSVSATGAPMIIGVVRAVKGAEAVVDTYVGGAPFVHGAHCGDVLTVVPLSKPVRVLGPGGADEVRPLSLDRRPGAPALAVVHPKEGAVDGAVGGGEVEHLRLRLFGAGVPWAVGRAVALERGRQPFSVAPIGALPCSLGGRRLGFPERMVQWGVDGSVRAGGGGAGAPPLLLPPFRAPGVHSLDHPDYVLIYLEEGKGSSTLQHRARGGVTSPFAKLVLYPLFREERMVPREAQLGSGESLSRFTLRFGAEFSFTLNLVSVLGG